MYVLWTHILREFEQHYCIAGRSTLVQKGVSIAQALMTKIKGNPVQI